MDKSRDIKGYEKLYSVNTDGEVFSKRKKKNVKWQENGNGYLTVTLYDNYKYKKFYVHRLIAEYFIDNPNSYSQVNHKDHDRSNNAISNLEWVTRQQNTQYSLPRKDKLHSQFKGVTWREREKKWFTRIKLNGKEISLGYHKDEKQAALAYNKKAKELFGKFALCNEVP